MKEKKRACFYNDLAESYRGGVDYSKIKETSVTAISKLKEKNEQHNCTSREIQEDRENTIFFKGCIAGMITTFATILFIMHFINMIMN